MLPTNERLERCENLCLTAQLVSRACEQVVEDVEGPLLLGLANGTRLLQQVYRSLCQGRRPRFNLIYNAHRWNQQLGGEGYKFQCWHRRCSRWHQSWSWWTFPVEKKNKFKSMTLFNRSTTRKLNQDSRIWRSCHFSLSWRFQRLPRSGWPAKAASPAPPSGDREDGKRKYKRAPYIWTAVCGGLKQKWYLMCFKSTGTPYVCCQDWPQCWTSDVLHLNIWSSISLLKQCSFTFNTFILNSHLIRNSMKGFINVYQCQKSRCQLHKDDELRWTEMMEQTTTLKQ